MTIREELRKAMLDYARRKGLTPLVQPEEFCRLTLEHNQPMTEKTFVSELCPVQPKNHDVKLLA